MSISRGTRVENQPENPAKRSKGRGRNGRLAVHRGGGTGGGSAICLLGCLALTASACIGGGPPIPTGGNRGTDGGVAPRTDTGKEKAPRVCTGQARVEDLNGNVVTPPTDESIIFDPKVVHSFKVEVAPKDWQWLNDNIALEEYVPATVVFDGKRFTGAAVKYKGAWTTLTNCLDENGKPKCSKLSMKVKFNKYDRCGRFYDLRRLIFNSAYYDGSLMRERISYGMMRQMGMMGSRVTHARMQINDQPASLYTVVEAVDKEYVQDLDRFKEADGNIYKGIWPVFTDPSRYLEKLRTNESEGDVSRMIAFARAIDQATPDNFAAAMAPIVDLSNVARMLAISRAISDDDGMTRFWCLGHGTNPNPKDCLNHNFYWYEEPGGLARLLPWDLDTSLYEIKSKENVSPDWFAPPAKCATTTVCELEKEYPCPPPETEKKVWPPQCDKLIQQAVRIHRADYIDALRKLAIALGQAILDVDTYAQQIDAAVRADPRLPVPDDGKSRYEKWVNGYTWLKTVLKRQKTAVEQFLAGVS